MSHTATHPVVGMSCGHCVNAVTEEVTKITGVTGVDVDLEAATVTVASDAPLDEQAFAAAIDEAGFEVGSA